MRRAEMPASILTLYSAALSRRIGRPFGCAPRGGLCAALFSEEDGKDGPTGYRFGQSAIKAYSEDGKELNHEEAY